jgi:TCP-1/cpn60 chaperonin family
MATFSPCCTPNDKPCKLKEIASKTSYLAGDGTTTATLLAHGIVREGTKAVAAGMNPMDLKRGIDLAVKGIVADLERNSQKVTATEEVAQVGTISSNGDAEIGRSIADGSATSRQPLVSGFPALPRMLSSGYSLGNIAGGPFEEGWDNDSQIDR